MVYQQIILDMLKKSSENFWNSFNGFCARANSVNDLIILSKTKQKILRNFNPPKLEYKNSIKIGMMGGYTFSPLKECLELLLEANDIQPSFFVGNYNNYISEILSPSSGFYQFRPELSILFPAELAIKFNPPNFESLSVQKSRIEANVQELLDLTEVLYSKINREIILANYPLPGDRDIGHFRSKMIWSEYIYKKYFNLELGLRSPNYLHICDVEFIANQLGTRRSADLRNWYETRQIGSMDFIFSIAKELAHMITTLLKPPKKVIIFDLDNTVWGGVIGDDGLDKIEIGDTSPRGEAFKEFQKYLLSQKNRGFLLAVCSKNQEDVAKEVFTKHPEMVIKLNDLVSFKANWKSKADNISDIVSELNIGLDAIVFIDDNPAEIDIVNQFLPEVSTISLSPDPSEHIGTVMNSRLLDIKEITAEDLQKTEMYQQEWKRKIPNHSVTNMKNYLKNLGIVFKINAFKSVDVKRITQLINKSNQFNLTTIRRTESEVSELIKNNMFQGFTVRLKDKFGDYGLISVIICEISNNQLLINTFLMSCRVLERQVEHEVMNQLVTFARQSKIDEIIGIYIPTKKNKLVQNLYQKFQFNFSRKEKDRTIFTLQVANYKPFSTEINIEKPVQQAFSRE